MKTFKTLLGPEICWIILYGLALGLAWANKKNEYAYDAIIENAWCYLPLVSILIFGLYWIPFVEKNGLLVRIWISSIIMGHLVLETTTKAYSSQDPGIGMGYLAGMLFLFFLLIVGSIVVKLVF